MFDFVAEYLITILVIIVILVQFLLNRFLSQERFLFLLNMAVLFQGVSIFLLRSKVPEHLGILLILTSGYYTINSIRENSLTLSGTNLSSTFIFNLKQIIPLKNLFPYVGIFIILIVFVKNWLFSDLFGQNDKLLIISAITWITYNHVPPSFNREKDFLFLFLNFLIAILVLPAFIYDFLVSKDDQRYGNELIYIFLVSPLENLLHITGYDVWDHEGLVTNSKGYKSGMLSYRMEDGTISSVFITEMCSGMYSIYIFSSAFAAFIFTEYKKWTHEVTLLLSIGLLTAYLANLLRMYLIILVGIYWGDDKLYWAHANFGWLIFIFWIGIFWNIAIPRIMISESR